MCKPHHFIMVCIKICNTNMHFNFKGKGLNVFLRKFGSRPVRWFCLFPSMKWELGPIPVLPLHRRQTVMTSPMLNNTHLIPIGRGWSAIKGALIPFNPINLFLWGEITAWELHHQHTRPDYSPHLSSNRLGFVQLQDSLKKKTAL